MTEAAILFNKKRILNLKVPHKCGVYPALFEKKAAHLTKSLPKRCGVYLFLAKTGKIIYIGKAADLKSRARSYFQKPASANPLKAALAKETAKIKWLETPSEIEALILEARLIKRHRPRFNVLLKDSTDYFYVGFTREKFPRVFLTHQTNKYKIPARFASRGVAGRQDKRYKIREFIGPFTDGTALKKTLSAVRRIFPFCTCRDFHRRPCLNSEMRRCPGVCCLKPELAQTDPDLPGKKREYGENIAALKKIITGKKTILIRVLAREMKNSVRLQEYERAAKLRDQARGVKEVMAHERVLAVRRDADDWPEIENELKKIVRAPAVGRIEAYDISNISGQNSAGSMAVFVKGEISPKDYRRFKIRGAAPPGGGNDPAMLKETISRRLRNKNWPLPGLIFVDGGRAQLNAAREALEEAGLEIPIISLAKGSNEVHLAPENKPRPLNSFPEGTRFLILRLRDQAHRFAVRYHRNLRKIR